MSCEGAIDIYCQDCRFQRKEYSTDISRSDKGTNRSGKHPKIWVVFYSRKTELTDYFTPSRSCNLTWPSECWKINHSTIQTHLVWSGLEKAPSYPCHIKSSLKMVWCCIELWFTCECSWISESSMDIKSYIRCRSCHKNLRRRNIHDTPIGKWSDYEATDRYENDREVSENHEEEFILQFFDSSQAYQCWLSYHTVCDLSLFSPVRMWRYHCTYSWMLHQ